MNGENRKFKGQEQETIKFVHLVCDFHNLQTKTCNHLIAFILFWYNLLPNHDGPSSGWREVVSDTEQQQSHSRQLSQMLTTLENQ